jgi:hypothetical protein
MNKYKKGLIIGPNGIGKVHIREFLKYGISNLAILGKSTKKRILQIEVRKEKKIKINVLKKFNQIKKYNPEIISLCTPHRLHLQHLKKIIEIKKYPIIVEKPFFYLKNKKFKKIKDIEGTLYKKYQNRLIVNLPMVELVGQIPKNEIPRKLKIIKFNYQTRGTHEFEEIAIDLLPHAFSFVFSILKQKLKTFSILKKSCKKKFWSCYIVINNVKCFFIFKQNPNNKKSALEFSLGKKKFKRVTIKKNFNEENFLFFNNKKINIKNPMSLSIAKSLKKLNQKGKINLNKRLVQYNNILTYKILKDIRK